MDCGVTAFRLFPDEPDRSCPGRCRVSGAFRRFCAVFKGKTGTQRAELFARAIPPQVFFVLWPIHTSAHAARLPRITRGASFVLYVCATRPCLSTLKGGLEIVCAERMVRQQVQGEPRLKAEANRCNIAPGPGCPSDASDALYKAVSASCATGQPTQRTLRASPVRHLDARLFEAIARRPDAHQALSLRYSSPSAPAALPVGPRNAHGVRALPVIPTTAEVIARRPNACQSLFVLSEPVRASRAARHPT